MPALFLEFIWGPRARSISPPGHWGLSEALQASWLRRGMEQTGSDFCPKASVSYRSGCQLGRMSRQQSRCAVTKRNRYHFKHTALERGGRSRKENPIMHFQGGRNRGGGLTLLWPHQRRQKMLHILTASVPLGWEGQVGCSRIGLILCSLFTFGRKELESASEDYFLLCGLPWQTRSSGLSLQHKGDGQWFSGNEPGSSGFLSSSTYTSTPL